MSEGVIETFMFEARNLSVDKNAPRGRNMNSYNHDKDMRRVRQNAEMIVTKFQAQVLSMRVEWVAPFQKCTSGSPVDHFQLFLPSQNKH